MRIDKIITLANERVKLQFYAMERSLRAAGCNLPIHVIPYDENLFDLPPNAHWWEIEELTGWLQKYEVFPAVRKYQCLLTENYQFVDSDIIFLKNPETVLAGKSGFITSCGHWHHTGHTCTDESLEFMKRKSTTWPKMVFNSGQFACDRILYTLEVLKRTCEGRYRKTLLTGTNLYKDQPAVNLLVNMSDVTIENLTLPPNEMQSTWAGDYESEYRSYWKTEAQKPYLIHWAGCDRSERRPVDELFYNFLTDTEKEEWDRTIKNTIKREHGKNSWASLKRLMKNFTGGN